MKIGLIQSQGIGDIIIGLPIAKYYADRGHQVFWPVGPAFTAFLQNAAPYVRFLPVPAQGIDFMSFSYHAPRKLLEAEGCERIVVLNMNLPAEPTLNIKLAGSLKFDEYKYAVAGVPFAEKWNLDLVRDRSRELALHKALGLDGRPYICLHTTGSNAERSLMLPQSWNDTYQIVPMEAITDSPLDWLYTIEHAAKRVMIDSVFSNITEQMNLTGDNYLIQRSVTALTPVYKNGWRFCWPGDVISDEEQGVPKRI